VACTYHRRDGRWETGVSMGNGKRRRFCGKTEKDSKAKMAAAYAAPVVTFPLVQVENQERNGNNTVVDYLD